MDRRELNENMEFWHDRLPEGNTLTSSIEEAKKIVCPLDLPHHRYHACINDCIMYRDEYKDRTTCPKCGHGRYKVGNKKPPRKVVWYFPLTPRLQRYYVDRKDAMACGKGKARRGSGEGLYTDTL